MEHFFDLSFTALIITVVGILVGIFFGALPGFGGSAGLAVVLPIAIAMEPLHAMVFLIGIYGGGHYGGGIPSVLVGVPGEASAAATVLDGFEMTRKGKAAEALAMVAMGSAVAGIVSVLAFYVFAPILAKASLSFGPPELFVLVIFGLSVLGALDLRRMAKALFAGFFGLALACIGVDPYMGEMRLTFDQLQLYEGIPFVPALLGLFCVAQMLALIEEKSLIHSDQKVVAPTFAATMRGMMETFVYWRALTVGTLAGLFIGILPGAGATIASFVGYTFARTVSKHPEQFGKGNPEGLIAPEAANNSCVGGSLIPTFALGIPGSGAAAVLMGVMIYMGLRPGPQLFAEQLPLIQTLVTYLLLGNVLMIVFGAMAANSLYRVSQIPIGCLVPSVIVIATVGAYAYRQEVFDVGVMLVFGAIGFVLNRHKYPLSAVVLGLVLGPMAEQYFVQSLAMSNWDFSIFFTRPLSLAIWVFILGAVFGSIYLFKKERQLSRAEQSEAAI